MSPWNVESVMMDVEKQRVDVTVSHPPNLLFTCPECGTESPVFDHVEERVGIAQENVERTSGDSL